ncbi:hypothetical protein [Zavarzinella formosa]|uniref:hypothetical protein n=1 Tax=Zavarzinella formosa TaxID=360055 RepID=UPI0003101D35|nr:hypothetical protein [Zavarzinella formosa]
MNRKYRLMIGLAITAAAVWLHSSAAAEEFWLDIWCADELEQQIARCEAANASMDRENQQSLGRIACREAVLKNLIANRISLDEAAKGFHALNVESPKTTTWLALMYPNASQPDCVKNQVLMQLKASGLPGARECHATLTEKLEWSASN